MADAHIIRGTDHHSMALLQILKVTASTVPTDFVWSEALLFGLGGGINLSYCPYQMGPRAHVHITVAAPDRFHAACQRLNLGLNVYETDGAKQAHRILMDAIGKGPAVIFADRASLPWFGMDSYLLKWLPPLPYVVSGFSSADGTWLVSGLGGQQGAVDATLLSEARAVQSGLRHRVIALEPPAEFLHISDAIWDAFDATIHDLFYPALPSYGLTALERWADALVERTGPAGWLALFADDGRLIDALDSAYLSIMGTYRTPAGRGLYADFLDIASDLLGCDLGEPAALYREALGAWRELAVALLPPHVPSLRRRRERLDERVRLSREDVHADTTRITDLSEQLESDREDIIRRRLFTRGERIEFLTEMREHVLAVHAAERAAARALRRVLTMSMDGISRSA